MKEAFQRDIDDTVAEILAEEADTNLARGLSFEGKGKGPWEWHVICVCACVRERGLSLDITTTSLLPSSQ